MQSDENPGFPIKIGQGSGKNPDRSLLKGWGFDYTEYKTVGKSRL
jgi:hypothetical protein